MKNFGIPPRTGASAGLRLARFDRKCLLTNHAYVLAGLSNKSGEICFLGRGISLHVDGTTSQHLWISVIKSERMRDKTIETVGLVLKSCLT